MLRPRQVELTLDLPDIAAATTAAHAAARPANAAPKPGDRSIADASAAPVASSAQPAQPAAKRSPYDHRWSDSIEAHERELRAKFESNEPIDEATLFRFPHQFIAPFRDTNLLAYLLMLTLMTAGGWYTFSYARSLLITEESLGSLTHVFGIIVGIFSAVLGLAWTVLACVVINQLVQAAAYERSVFDPPEVGVHAWFSSFLVVGVSLWASSVPGGILGTLTANVIGMLWPIFIFTLTSVFLFAPVGILSAYYNGSPFKVISSDVLATFVTHRDGWLRFYAWMAIWLVVDFMSLIFGLIPVVGIPIEAFIDAVCVVLVGRTIGLLAQAFIVNWVADDEA